MASMDGATHSPIYRGLDSARREIRLLILHAGRGDDLVCCALSTVSLDEEPSYEAISYCWGDPDARSAVSIAGVQHSFPINTVAALKRMRLPDADRTLWIDAICINQHDLEERAQQVLMMGHVYSKSRGTLIHLGEEESWSPAAVDSIALTIQDARRETDGLHKLGATLFDGEDQSRRISDSPMGTRVDADALNHLFGLPYFSRLWVVQETILSPRNTCFLGPHQLSFLDILRAAQWLRYKQYHVSEMNNSLLLSSWWMYFDRDHSPLASANKNGRLTDVSDLLFLGEGRHCTDPRDRIYGLIGLFDGDIPPKFHPDYSKDFVDLMCDAMRAAMSTDEWLRLDLLRNFTHETRQDLQSDEWPSWLLKWDGRGTSNYLASFTADGRAQVPSQQWLRDQHGRELRLLGFTFDDVRSSSQTLERANAQHQPLLQEWLEDVMKNCPPVISTAAIAATLIAGARHGQRSYPDPKPASHVAEFELFRSALRTGSLRSTGGLTSPNPDIVRTTEYLFALYRACLDRKIFVTQQGYIGVGPALLEPGDVVAVLPGGSIPFLLRPSQDGKFKLVGSCYVHGIMYGEAMEVYIENNIPWERFTIG